MSNVDFHILSISKREKSWLIIQPGFAGASAGYENLFYFKYENMIRFL